MVKNRCVYQNLQWSFRPWATQVNWLFNDICCVLVFETRTSLDSFTSQQPWHLLLRWQPFLFMNMFFSNFYMMFTMPIFFCIVQCLYYLLRWYRILSQHLYQAQGYGINLPVFRRNQCLHWRCPAASTGPSGGRWLHAGPHRVQPASASSTFGSTGPQVGPYTAEVLYGILQQPKKANLQSAPKAPSKHPRTASKSLDGSTSPPPVWTDEDKKLLRKLSSNPMRKLDIRGRSSPASLTNRSLMSRLCGTTSRLDWASRTRW